MLRTRNALVIDDEPDLAEVVADYAKESGLVPHIAHNYEEAIKILDQKKISLVISDHHMPGKSGIQILNECYEKYEVQGWILITADSTPEIVEKAASVGTVDVLLKPIDQKEFSGTIERIRKRQTDPLREIVDIVTGISGIRFEKEKTNLVKTRLGRRIRELGLKSTEDYLKYFKQNRNSEVTHMVSNLTTHTTEFFREEEHFDYLAKVVFPFFRKKKRPIRIWSAACSTGEEVYSLAICFFEYCRKNNVTKKEIPAFEIVGTDIDFKSVEKSESGIYQKDSLKKISPFIVKEYFDHGTGKISHLVRIKDFVHQQCSFMQNNLQSPHYKVEKFDIIFLRNTLIYFDQKTNASIAKKLSRHLEEDGFLFLGHSESIANLDVPFNKTGNAIYRPKAWQPKNVVQIKDKKPLPSEDKAEKKISVLIVDDSLTIRKTLKKIMQADPLIEVVGEANHPLEAEEILSKTHVDVMTLDINMPKMDGITYLEKISKEGLKRPPVVIVSEVGYDQAVRVLGAKNASVVEYIQKPDNIGEQGYGEKVCSAIQVASKFKQVRTSVDAKSVLYTKSGTKPPVIAIGASTGGVEAIQDVLSQFPNNSPPTLIVQHMPPLFTKAFADRLNEKCKISVKEAVDYDLIQPGTAYVAPGGKQMRLRKSGREYRIQITDDAKVNRFKPSVDYLFSSISPLTKDLNVSAALLTGMGIDGAKGLQSLRQSGAFTVAQNEESCVVYGMPGEAVRINAAVRVSPLQKIADQLFRGLAKKDKKAA